MFRADQTTGVSADVKHLLWSGFLWSGFLWSGFLWSGFLSQNSWPDGVPSASVSKDSETLFHESSTRSVCVTEMLKASCLQVKNSSPLTLVSPRHSDRAVIGFHYNTPFHPSRQAVQKERARPQFPAAQTHSSDNLLLRWRGVRAMMRSARRGGVQTACRPAEDKHLQQCPAPQAGVWCSRFNLSHVRLKQKHQREQTHRKSKQNLLSSPKL